MPVMNTIYVLGTEYESITAAARALGIPVQRARQRLARLPENPDQESIDRCFTTNDQRGKPIKLAIDGQEFDTMAGLARHLGIDPSTLSSRIGRLGPNPTAGEIEAVLRPEGRSGSNDVPITVRGVKYKSIKLAAETHGLTPSVVRLRLHRAGHDLSQAQIDNCFLKSPERLQRPKRSKKSPPFVFDGHSFPSSEDAKEKYKQRVVVAQSALEMAQLKLSLLERRIADPRTDEPV